MWVNEAEYKGKKVKLNKPFRNTTGKKKYAVYVRNPKTDNIIKVGFGDPNMEIKRDDPERRKAFRSRHKCDTAKDKTKARYWSCKFWSTKNVSDLLKEVIKPEEITTDSIQFHDNLNDIIWNDNGLMRDDVRLMLLKNAKLFIEYLGFENLEFNDIILTGSMANYNYHENSDIDLHVILDYNQISDDEELVTEYLKMKKNSFNEKILSTIKNHDIELYFQNSDEAHHSMGTYSLIKNNWINKPTKKIVDVNVSNIKEKAKKFIDEFNVLEQTTDESKFIKKYETIKNKLKKLRQGGLEREGEFSVENLVFKVLRNIGFFEKINELRTEIISKKLSINENKQKKIIVTSKQLSDYLKYKNKKR